MILRALRKLGNGRLRRKPWLARRKRGIPFIRHYRPYILSLCRREYIAENGNVSIVCDNELKLRLEAKLMAKILLFDIRERTYKT